MSMESISILGIVVMVLLVTAVIVLFALIDRRFLKRLLKSFVVAVLMLAATGGCMALLNHYNSWWILLLAVIFAALACAWYESQQLRFIAQRSLISLCMAYLMGVLSFAGTTWLLLKNMNDVRLVLPPVLMLGILFIQKSVTIGLRTYQSCLRHTREHYLYLVANGATHLEASLPTIRRTLRATALPLLRLMAMPIQMGALLLVAGLLIGGVSPVSACLFTLMLQFATLVSSVLLIVSFIWLCK